MSLLRIHCQLQALPARVQWTLLEPGRAPVAGEGPLAALPRRAARVQLVLDASAVLLTQVKLPRGAKRRAGSVLAFAVEEQTLGEPDANQASWLSSSGDADALAVIDKKHLARWLDALAAAGIRDCEVQCETLLLPRATGEWSVAWNGRDGCVRTGDFDGAATDNGDARMPPLSLRLLAGSAVAACTAPAAIAIYTTAPAAAPDLAAWGHALGVPLRLAGAWDWRAAPPAAGVNLLAPRPAWRALGDLLPRLRNAAVLVAVALALHALAMVIDWTLLRGEQRALRQQMEARFRATVPDALAVVDPVLQMSRKLAEARHRAGAPDNGDFLPMLEQVAAALNELPAGGLRSLAFEPGRLSLSLAGVDEAAARRLVTRLRQGGSNLEASVAARDAGGALVVTVRAP
jgi:general secretion pathway protein L